MQHCILLFLLSISCRYFLSMISEGILTFCNCIVFHLGTIPSFINPHSWRWVHGLSAIFPILFSNDILCATLIHARLLRLETAGGVRPTLCQQPLPPLPDIRRTSPEPQGSRECSSEPTILAQSAYFIDGKLKLRTRTRLIHSHELSCDRTGTRNQVPWALLTTLVTFYAQGYQTKALGPPDWSQR